MINLPDDLFSAEQTREMDSVISEQHNIPIATLMARAGTAALASIKEHWPHAKRILILCGIGNNGGDGFELALQALAESYHVTVIQLGTAQLSAEASAARDAFSATGAEIQHFKGILPATDVVVDALLGTGLNRDVSGELSAIITVLNKLKHTPVLSLDIPSGLHADTGFGQGQTVKATVTLSFLALNKGLFLEDGLYYSGSICFDPLQIHASILTTFKADVRRISLSSDATLLSPRERTGHKGLYGHLLVMGGDQGMSGAVRMAAEAGARVGAGLTSIATRNAHSALLTLTRPELMCYGVENTDDLSPLIKRANALTVGTGLGQTAWAECLFQAAIESPLPMVIDADALNILSHNPHHRDNWILTPHPGEAARLLGCTSAEIQADRFQAVQALQQRYGGIVVLKGSATLINNGETPTRLSTWGNPGMASGGMGDVLTGVIGGLLAQGLPLMDAACVGVTLHGMAADKSAEQEGERGMLAMDLMPHLRHLANLIY